MVPAPFFMAGGAGARGIQVSIAVGDLGSRLAAVARLKNLLTGKGGFYIKGKNKP